MENFISLILFGFAAFFLFSMIKNAPEHERFAVIVLGRFQKLMGPGLVLKLPGTARVWKRIAVGDEGEYLGDGTAKFGNVMVPIEDSNMTEGHRVRITSFRENKIWTADAGPKRSFVPCQRCGYKTAV